MTCMVSPIFAGSHYPMGGIIEQMIDVVEPRWNGRNRIETWFTPNYLFGPRPVGWLWIETKKTYGWYREWHFVTYDEGQVNTQIVLAQDFVTTTGASTYTSKASWNNVQQYCRSCRWRRCRSAWRINIDRRRRRRRRRL